MSNPFRQSPHPILQPIPTAKIKEYIYEDGVIVPEKAAKMAQLIEEREQAIRLAEEDPLNHGFELEHWKLAENILEKKTSVIALGGNRCLAGEQVVEVNGVLSPIGSVKQPFYTRALDEETGEEVRAIALTPFQKPPQDLYRYFLSDGTHIACSQSHRVLANGQWHSMSELSDDIFPDARLTEMERDDYADLPLSDGDHLLTIVDIDLLGSPEDARRCWKTVQDSLSDYRLFYRCGDGQLREVQGSVLGASPSLDDVLRCISYVFADLGDLGCKPLYTRFYLLSDRPANLDGLRQIEALFFDNESDAFYKPCKSASLSREDQVSCKAHPQSTVEFFRQLRSIRGFARRGILSYHISAYKGNVEYFSPVVKSVFLRNDVVYDFEVPHYHNYFIGNSVSHNSGKTEWGARSIVKAALSNPDSRIVCFAQDADASIRVQQAAVYRYLPPEYKKKTKGQVEYINYTAKNGFTGGSLIFPNGSHIYFHTYSQFIANRSKFEGMELGSKDPSWLNIGLWLDEYLEDGDLVETMRFRLATRNALMIITVTPIDGHTPFIASFLKDAETKKTRPAELLNGEELPLMQICSQKDAGIAYFHSILNPFGGYERIAKELEHSPRDEILTRAYGIPVKSMTTLFPLFSTNVHVIKDLPKIGKETHTVYQVVDPAGARNYVSIWAAVDKDGYVTILREWPDRDTYGEWATFGDPKWKFGPAAKKIGYDVKGYVELFREIEGELGVEVFERIGDSRYFARENDDNLDLFSQFADHDMDFVPADGRHEDMGLTALDEWFQYNPNAEVDAANRPILQIHESCGNLIYSLINYGQHGKKDEPLKDFIDVLRYLRMANAGEGPEHYDNKAFEITSTTGGY